MLVASMTRSADRNSEIREGTILDDSKAWFCREAEETVKEGIELALPALLQPSPKLASHKKGPVTLTIHAPDNGNALQSVRVFHGLFGLGEIPFGRLLSAAIRGKSPHPRPRSKFVESTNPGSRQESESFVLLSSTH